MTALNLRPGSVAIAAAAAVMHQRAQAGYADALARRGYAAAFDRWSTDQQLAYETGRLWGSNIAAAGLPAPAWPPDRVPSLEVRQAAASAAARAGDAIPGERLPDSDDLLPAEPGSVPRPTRHRRQQAPRRR